MSHISLPDGVPGIIGPMMQYPETEKPLNELAQALLRGPSPLSEAEREMIASFVSSENDCYFCAHAHGSTAEQFLGPKKNLMVEVRENYKNAKISNKMKALLNIAKKIQMGGKNVTAEDIEKARDTGADDKAIHDTVLIAAAFCMFNRYVDGLATWTPKDKEIYEGIGHDLSTKGYLNSIPRD